MRLSVLDQSPIPEARPAPTRSPTRSTSRACASGSAITATGWPSTTAGRRSPGPEPRGADRPGGGATSTMRIGSGGVMLPHYSPFKVAETFSLLAGLFPGRIDLGIGRAAGTDPMTTFARSARPPRTAAPDDFPEQPAELLAHYEQLPADHPFRRLGRRCRARRTGPRCGCSAPRPRARSGPASSGCPTRSRTSSTPTARRSPSSTASASRVAAARAPGVSVAVWAICADTDEKAERIAALGAA